jgi:hypothetical protein
MQGRKLDLLILQLKAGALDGGLELDGSLVTEGLVDYAGRTVLIAFCGSVVIVGGLGDRGKLEGEGELEVGLGDDFRLFWVEFLLVSQRSAGVGDSVGVPGTREFWSAKRLGRERVMRCPGRTSRSREKSRPGDRACPRDAP